MRNIARSLAFGVMLSSSSVLMAHSPTSNSEAVGVAQVTVVIPPLVQAIRAQESGATGLWSVLNGNAGLMLSSNFDEGAGELSVDLFGADLAAIRLTSFDGTISATPLVHGSENGLHHSTMKVSFAEPQRWSHNPMNPHSKVFVIGTL